MELADALRAYRQRWEAVEAFHQEEQRNSTVELRWRQLNSAYNIARELGILQPDPSELEVFRRWALIKKQWEKNLKKS